MNSPVSVEARWDEPWRSVTEGHWRFLGLLLGAKSESGALDGHQADVSIRFWADGVQVESIILVSGTGEALQRLATGGTETGATMHVTLVEGRPTLLCAVIRFEKVLGLASEPDVPVGEVQVALQDVDRSPVVRKTLALTQAISRTGPVDIAILAVSAAADLATREVDDAHLAWIATMLARGEATRPPHGLFATLNDIVRSARSPKPEGDTLRARAARVAADLTAEFWPSLGAEPTCLSKHVSPGTPYDLCEDDLSAARPIESPRTPASGAEYEATGVTGSPLSVFRDDEWHELERQFFAVCECNGKNGVVRVWVAGIQVCAHLDLDRFPTQAPVLITSADLTHRLIRPDGLISSLTSLRQWNRTLGLPHVLRELEGEWGKQPPESMFKASIWTRLRNRILSMAR